MRAQKLIILVYLSLAVLSARAASAETESERRAKERAEESAREREERASHAAATTAIVVHAFTSDSNLPLPPAYVPPPKPLPSSSQGDSGSIPLPPVPPPASAVHAAAGLPTAPVAPTSSNPPTAPAASNSNSVFQHIFESLGIVKDSVDAAGVTPGCAQCEAQISQQGTHSTITSGSGVAANLKNESELLRYVTCYSDHPEWTQAYSDSYIKYIRTASVQFGIPETLLTCLLFRESQFNKDAKSTIERHVKGRRVSLEGAAGVAQFMPVTEKFVSNIISVHDLAPEKLKLLTEVATGDGASHNLKDQVYAQTALDNYRLAGLWSGYFDQLKKQGLYHGNTPDSFADKEAHSPEIAIGASAFYLRYMIDLFQGELNENGRVPTGSVQSPDPNFLLTITGSYNLGHGAALKILRPVKPPSAKAWYDRLYRSNNETQGHMKSVRNCIEPNNFAPSEGTSQRTCQ